jgi:hypothetical protein
VTPPATARTAGKTRPPLSTTAYAAGAIDKLSERKTPKGLRIAFADRPVGKKADTVIIIIPLDTTVPKEVASSDPTRAPAPEESLFRPRPDSSGKSDSAGSAGPDSAAIASTEKIVRDDPNTIHVYVSAAKKAPRTRPDSSHTPPSQGTADQKVARNKPDTAPNPPAASSSRELYRKPDSSSPKSTAGKVVVMNSDCRNFATDYDVDKLRVKMLDADKDDDKIQAARKIFKTKCFTTKQIRALSEVFTTDAGKYRFFEAAYPFVSDDHFRELTDLLADPVYNGKFRAMTGQQ